MFKRKRNRVGHMRTHTYHINERATIRATIQACNSSLIVDIFSKYIVYIRNQEVYPWAAASRVTMGCRSIVGTPAKCRGNYSKVKMRTKPMQNYKSKQINKDSPTVSTFVDFKYANVDVVYTHCECKQENERYGSNPFSFFGNTIAGKMV